MKTLKSTLLALIFSVFSIGVMPIAHAKNTYIFHDAAFDDIFALYLTLLQPEANVKLIVVEATGEATCEQGLFSTLGVLHHMGRLDIEVQCGPERTLSDKLQGISQVFPEKWRLEVNDLNALVWGYPLPNKNGHVGYHEALDIQRLNRNIRKDIQKIPEVKKKYQKALAQFQADRSLSLIANFMQNQNEPAYILETGPSVTLGHLAKYYPDALDNISAVMIMGGSFEFEHDRPGVWGKLGNIQTVFTPSNIINEDAEWNVYISPLDFDVFLQSAKQKNMPVYLVPLNASTRAKIKPEYLQCIQRHKEALPKHETYQAILWANELTEKILKRYQAQIDENFLDFWDTLSAHFFTDHIVEPKREKLTQEYYVVIDSDKQHFPKEFYNKYRDKKLDKYYRPDFQNFEENLNQHHSWAKIQLNSPDALDRYGVTHAYQSFDTIPADEKDKAVAVQIFKTANEQEFADHFLQSLTGQENLYQSCIVADTHIH